jgi:hypothetical protein
MMPVMIIMMMVTMMAAGMAASAHLMKMPTRRQNGISMSLTTILCGGT